ncbi:MAG TPA: DNA translocase FtsK [Thermoleophilaceae bacterium]|nr:DNA translocase FtsK [Thermoleophilaceae bacterium]
MASRTRTRKAPPGRSARRTPPALPSLAELEQRHLDLIGLGLVALACFLAFVFYLGWEGGSVGETLARVIVLLLGVVGYAAPLVLLAAGALLILRPILSAVRPFRTGTLCLLAAMTLGLAAGSLGLGPEEPARRAAFMSDPRFLESHGGLVGETLRWLSTTLVQDVGTHLLFAFLLITGLLLLTGASVAGILRATGTGVATTTRRVRDSTGELATAVSERASATGAGVGRRRTNPSATSSHPDTGEPSDDRAPEVEPLIRATHVEAPSPRNLDDLRSEIQDAAVGDLPEFAPGEAPTLDARRGPGEDEQDGGPGDSMPPRPEDIDSGAGEEIVALTPQGNRRTRVAESEELTYRLPGTGLLARSSGRAKVDRRTEDRDAALLVEALGHFSVDAQVIGTVAGPHVTRYELRLAPGTKMSKVSQLRDDLAYALAAQDVRILAPIPGARAVGVEVPNRVRQTVHLGDVFQEAPTGWSPLTVWLGKDIAGKAIGADLAKQPHLLVAGTTGSGKSGCVNAMLSSILLRATPNQVKLVLVDPKQVELNYYDHVPHLLTPVGTNPRLAANVLGNLIKEMEARYSVMSEARARNLVELNRIRERQGEAPLPYILCVIDELADLMMIAPADVEDAIIRLAQKSRAVGIHLVLATQRPSADIITGMIKANVPARIAFAVSSQTDSRVILDQNGAESLLGEGDMLFRPAGESRLARIKGAFVGEGEIEELTAHWREQGEPELQEELLEALEVDEEGAGDFDADADDLLADAVATVVQMGTASTSMLQRRLRVGYTRAGRLIDMMERRGVISGYEGSKARQVLVTEADLPRVLATLESEGPGVAGDGAPPLDVEAVGAGAGGISDP